MNKQAKPTIIKMMAYYGDCTERFTLLNAWLTNEYGTGQTITFPYGNQYGWGIARRKSRKRICHVFPEGNAFTVMMRLSNKQSESVYSQIQKDMQEQIDHKYPCGSGGWIHFRVIYREQFDDIQTLLMVKCA